MRLFDSHCHIQDERFDGLRDGILARAGESGVCGMVCCGTSPNDWESVTALADSHEAILPSFGVHPWFVENLPGDWLNRLRSMVQANSISAIGEIGLDYVVENVDRELQKKVFERQLDLALELNRPVSVHCRKAWGDLVELLKDRAGTIRGLIHNYSGSAEIASRLTSMGLYLSFGGMLTRSRNRRGHDSLRKIDIDRILLETDSPDLAPIGIEQPYNEPANLKIICNAAAEILGKTPDSLAEQTSQNARKLFIFPQAGFQRRE